MCRGFISVCLALVFSLSSISYATQLARWNSTDYYTGMDGWTSTPSDPVLTPGATVGVTEGTGSLQVEHYGDHVTGFNWDVQVATWDYGVLFTPQDIQNNSKIEFDVTRLVSDWGAAMQGHTTVGVDIVYNYSVSGQRWGNV